MTEDKDLSRERLLSADPAAPAEAELIGEESETELEGLKTDTNDTKKITAIDTVRKFNNLIESGVPPETAAKKVEKELVTFGNREEVIKKLQDIMVNFSFSADVVRAAVRASRMKVLIEALANEDPDMALKAAKQIASDPEVGLEAPPVTNVNLEIRAIKDLLDLRPEDVIDVQ